MKDESYQKLIGSNNKSSSTPKTAPSSPFFHPSTPQHVVVVQRTPGGSRKAVLSQQSEPVKEGKTGIVGCSANLVNAIVGSGIVGMPYAIQQAGFGAGIFLIVWCAILTEKSLRLLVATAKHVHAPSYETVAEAAFGIGGFRFVAINMFIMAYGAMISYLLIVKDLLSTVLGVDSSNYLVKRSILVVASLLVMFPLSSKRDMADLAFTSRLSVFIDCLLVGLIAWNAPIQSTVESVGGWKEVFDPFTSSVPWLRTRTIFVGLGVLSFAYVCQHSAFMVAGSLENPTLKRWGRATASALSIACLLEFLCGVTGYLGYMDKVNGNILNNLDGSSMSAQFGRVMLTLTMFFVYPMESFVARHVCIALLFSGRRAHDGNDDSSILNRRDRRIGLTFLLYVVAVLPAAIFEDVGIILAITGAVGGSCLSYIGPGAVFLGVHGGRFLELVYQCMPSCRPEPEKAEELQTKTHSVLPIETTNLVETTPLVVEHDKIPDEDEEVLKQVVQEKLSNNTSLASSIRDHILWYATGMPIWSRIAQVGKKGMTKYVHDMALKSPYPIRIGDVEYRRVPISKTGRIQVKASHGEARDIESEHGTEASTPTSTRSSSPVVLDVPRILASGTASDLDLFIQRYDVRDAPAFGLPESAPHKLLIPPSGESMDLQIGRQLTKQRQQRKQQPSDSNMQQQGPREPDPQEAPPTWTDFVVAIFYIIFGVVALLAGFLSIVQS